MPVIIEYDDALLDTAAQEAEGGQCVAHVELGKDYKKTRDQLRIAKEELSQ